MLNSFELVRSRERTLFGPDLVKDAEEKVKVIRENLKLAQIRQKSYHDKGTAPRVTPKILSLKKNASNN
jgi:hypothetical protein